VYLLYLPRDQIVACYCPGASTCPPRDGQLDWDPGPRGFRSKLAERPDARGPLRGEAARRAGTGVLEVRVLGQAHEGGRDLLDDSALRSPPPPLHPPSPSVLIGHVSSLLPY